MSNNLPVQCQYQRTFGNIQTSKKAESSFFPTKAIKEIFRIKQNHAACTFYQNTRSKATHYNLISSLYFSKHVDLLL